MKFFSIVLLITLTTFCMNAQQSSVLIEGTIQKDSLNIKDVHILNLNSKLGVVSDSKGKFEIEAKHNDTLLISGLQYYKQKIGVTEEIIKQKRLEVQLSIIINELEEVVLSKTLSGNLAMDSKKIERPKPVIDLSSEAFNFSTKGLKPESVLDDEARRHTSDNSTLGGPEDTRMDVFAIVGIITKPLIDKVKNNIKKKKAKKRKKRLFDEKVREAPNEIRKDFGDAIFIEMGIPKEHIHRFIEFCEPYQIGMFFVKGDKIKVLDIFLKYKEEYKKLYNL